MSTLYVWKQAGPKTPRIYQAETCLIRSSGVVSISPIKTTLQIRRRFRQSKHPKDHPKDTGHDFCRVKAHNLVVTLILVGLVESISTTNQWIIYEWLISLFLRGYIVIWYNWLYYHCTAFFAGLKPPTKKLCLVYLPEIVYSMHVLVLALYT